MHNPDNIFDSLELIFWEKILKFFDADPDPGSGIFFEPGSGIRNGKNSDPGSWINIPDPQGSATLEKTSKNYRYIVKQERELLIK
jgi:hypothetical protein